MTKLNDSYEPHLTIRKMSLLPGTEWSLQLPGWAIIQVAAGSGYWLHAKRNQELEPGTVLMLAPNSKESIRASQLGELSLCFFSANPSRLGGLITVIEQNFFREAELRENFLVRAFPRHHPIALRLEKLCADQKSGSLCRLQLLQVFLEMFENELSQETSKPEGMTDAKGRLLEFLEQTPAADLLTLSFTELVRTTRCTPRHLSRIFREVVGMSYRDKHAELRLTRACELLATTEAKVVDVALESGYQSLSLFNLMFARRFGVSPGKWREKQAEAKMDRTRRRRKAMLAMV